MFDDVLFQVNGCSLENVSHDEAANALKNTQDYVRLLVAKATSSGGNSIPTNSPRQRAPGLGTVLLSSMNLENIVALDTDF